MAFENKAAAWGRPVGYFGVCPHMPFKNQQTYRTRVLSWVFCNA